MSKFNFVPRATALAAATFAWSLSAPVLAASPPIYSPAPPAAPACSSITSAIAASPTYQDYQGLSPAGCTVGALTYYNFTNLYEWVDGNPTYVNQANNIFVTPGANTSAPSLRFSSPTLFDRTGLTTSADYYFEYYMDPPIDILGFQLDDAPFAGNSYVEASVCVGGRFGPYGGLTGGEGVPGYGGGYGGGEGAPTFAASDSGYSSPADDCYPREVTALANVEGQQQNDVVEYSPQYYYFQINGTTPNDGTIFDYPDFFADVLVHVHIGPDGNVPDFGTQAVVVPEPAEWTLTGLGGLAMLGVLGRKRRRASSTPA